MRVSQADTDSDVRVPFPLEFVIGQTPVSGQTKNRRARERWERIVRQHATDTINIAREQFFLDERPLMVTIYYFPPAIMDGDLTKALKRVPFQLSGICAHDACLQIKSSSSG
jgi:crossover junction endodeoxyribonuclease RusA